MHLGWVGYGGRDIFSAQQPCSGILEPAPSPLRISIVTGNSPILTRFGVRFAALMDSFRFSSFLTSLRRPFASLFFRISFSLRVKRARRWIDKRGRD